MGKNGLSHRWLALLTVSIGAFIATLDVSIVNISLPGLGKALGVEPSVVLWVTVGYLLSSVSLMLTVGKMGDILGRKKIYTVGFAIFTGGLILCSLSEDIHLLILSRIVQGTGAAMIVSLGTAILVSAFPVTELGKALGMLGAVVSAGLLTGPVLGGYLLDLMDWRAIFYTRIPIGIAGTVMAWILLREDRPSEHRLPFDWPGAVILCASLSCLLLSVNVSGKGGFGSPLVLILAGTGVLLMVLFVMQERRTKNPTVDLVLFRDPVFTGGNLSLSIMFFSLGCFTFLMPFYFIDGLGHTSTQTGLLIAVVSLTTLVVSPLSGWLSDRIGYRVLCPTGVALMSAALFLISRLGAGSGAGDIVPMLVVYGIGTGLFQSPNYSAIMTSSPKNRLGTASAMIATIRQVSIAVGVAVSGTFFVSYQAFLAGELARQGVAPALIGKLSIVGGFQKTVLMAAIVCGLGIFTTLIRDRTPAEKRSAARSA